jgi:hypothetical protein
LSHPLPCRRRRRRGNQGQAGSGTSLAVERVNGVGAPTEGASGTDLTSETKTSVASLQHANLKQTHDASTLAKDLLGVTLVPETTVQSVPDATSSPTIDRKPSGSEEDGEPDLCWDFSGLGNPSAVRDFMTACDYYLSDCSDGSRGLDNEDRGPSHECFHVDLGGPGEGNHLGMPENGDPPRPVPRVDILRELAVVPVPAGGPDPQLEQIRERQARLDEGAGTLVPIRRDIGQEWAVQPPAGEVRHLPQDIHHRIADDVRVRPPPDSSGVGQNLAVAAILLRAMPEPSTTEGRRIQGELKNLLENVAVRKLCLPKAGVPLGTSRRDFPIHAGSLGPLRAHAQHSACSPGSPRQRASSSQPSGPPRRQGVPRLPPQAWGTLRQRGGSESFARTTRSTGFQPRHTTGTVPDPVLNPDYYHKVLGGDETGTVARGLSASLPTGWNGR